jgi:anti-sigma regulatory factor (Ser/Thr protein kinase)
MARERDAERIAWRAGEEHAWRSRRPHGRKESTMPAEATHISDPVADPALLPYWLILGSVMLLGRPEHVREARKFVARTIGADHPRADTALLLTSELVTNAVTHSKSGLPGGTIELVVAAQAAGLLISVADNGSDATVPTVGNDPGAENGNGLRLVESLADAWGYLRDPARTAVWFRLRTHEWQPHGLDAALLLGCLPHRRTLVCGPPGPLHQRRPAPALRASGDVTPASHGLMRPHACP